MIRTIKDDKLYSAFLGFVQRMQDKLAKKEQQGRTGWDDSDAVTGESLLYRMLRKLANFEFVDVANFAMMLNYRFFKNHDNKI